MLVIIGREAAEGMLASKIINKPNNEANSSLRIRKKKRAGIMKSFTTTILATVGISKRKSDVLLLANHAPKIIIERGKLVSPIIFKGAIIISGIYLPNPVYTKNKAMRVLTIGAVKSDFTWNCSSFLLKIKKVPTDHIKTLNPRI
jgi:hypothetical protein